METVNSRIDVPQLFWDCFRRRWRAELATWTDGGPRETDRWTSQVKQAARAASSDFCEFHGIEAKIDGEKIKRLDVHATDATSNELIVAFESELAPWGYNGNSGKDWREEFLKLSETPARLRALFSTFEPKSGSRFPSFLLQKIRELQRTIKASHDGPFCLMFGPEETRRDPSQPWLAFALESGPALRPLQSKVQLVPRRVMKKLDPATE